MSGFSADWLALREPYDHQARNAEMRAEVAQDFKGHPAVSIVDLACGTGSTLRNLAPQLPAAQHWRLIDNDLSLLARATAGVERSGLRLTPRPLDLVQDLERALEPPVDLVTTSALLDLVSRPWLERLVTEAAVRRLPVYAALTYNGHVALNPPLPSDRKVIAAVDAHQHRDKGFGAALGPEAAPSAERLFRSVGYHVASGAADWVFNRNDRDIQLQVVDGWAAAAREGGRMSLRDLDDWLQGRRAAIADGRSTMRIGHTDIYARPDQSSPK